MLLNHRTGAGGHLKVSLFKGPSLLAAACCNKGVKLQALSPPAPNNTAPVTSQSSFIVNHNQAVCYFSESGQPPPAAHPPIHHCNPDTHAHTA